VDYRNKLLLFWLPTSLSIGYEQLYSSPSDREKNEQKTIYNKHLNTIGTLDYQAVNYV